jgi:flavin reductase (DIM6/NTAB) family NADH-FMN oxidoreductase RutF
MLFDFAALTPAQRSKLLLATVVPRPIAWVVTRHANGATNAAPFSFFNLVSSDPPILCLGVAARRGGDKDTVAHIRRSGEFVVNLVPAPLAEQMNLTSLDFDAGTDELAEAGLTATPSERVDPPRIAESPVAMECELFRMLDLGNGQSVVLGRVVAMHIRDDAVLDPERCHVDTPKLDLIARMHGSGWYARTTDRFDMPRPPTPKPGTRRGAEE